MLKLFNKNLTKINRDYVIDNYSPDEWDNVITICKNKIITNDAVKLAIKIFNATGIKLFPVIHSRRPSYNQKQSGAWSWILYGFNLTECGSEMTVKECLKSKYVKLNNYFYSSKFFTNGTIYFHD